MIEKVYGGEFAMDDDSCQKGEQYSRHNSSSALVILGYIWANEYFLMLFLTIVSFEQAFDSIEPLKRNIYGSYKPNKRNRTNISKTTTDIIDLNNFIIALQNGKLLSNSIILASLIVYGIAIVGSAKQRSVYIYTNFF